jgi:hypothetical protein
MLLSLYLRHFQETPFAGEGIASRLLLCRTILSELARLKLKRLVRSESPGLSGPSSRLLDRSLRRISEAYRHAVVRVH